MAVPYGENQYIYGFHDPGGEHLLKDGDKAKGWVLVTEEIRANPNDQGGKGDFYKRLADQGFGVIVRLNHAYGPDGTIPLESAYPNFAQRAANFVKNSPGAHIWIIGNEMNFEREQPRLPNNSGQAEPITPRRYAECYKRCRQAIKSLPGHEDDQVVVGAIGPWNGQTPYDADPQGKYPVNKLPGGPGEYPYHGAFGDYILYMRDMLLAIGRENCDAIAIHAYSHGYDPNLVFNDGKMGAPFDKYFYHFRTYKDQMNIIPNAFRDLPVYLTESNGDANPDGSKWPDVNSGWIKNAYKEINEWNSSGNQQIRCVILYRWSRDDDWHIDGKGQVHQDLRDAIAKNYTWEAAPKAEAKPQPTPAPAPEPDSVPQPAVPRPETPGYRTRYLSHNTPTTLKAAQTLQVTLTLQNVGSFTWVKDGPNPFRLGFQWYNDAGQFIQFPSAFDFRAPLPDNVPPNKQVTLKANLRTPDAAGTYQLRWDMVHEMVTWFTTQGDAGLLVSPLVVEPVEVAIPEQPQQPVGQVQIQNISGQLAQHPSKRYVQRPIETIRRVIVHHSGTPPQVTAQRIAEYQVSRDLPGISYHFCTTDQGIAYQTQPLTLTAAHAGQNSRDSVGVCLIGNFTSAPPPEAQLNATASVLAQILASLNLTTDSVFGYSEIENTQSPGNTWPSWKGTLLSRTQALIGKPVTIPTPTPSPTPTPTPSPTPSPRQKQIEQYMLFWRRGADDWAEWDFRGALTYIGKFGPTPGFSIEEAKLAQFVTIIGGPGGVPANTEETLRAAGCKVERIAGATETETRRILEDMARQNQRYKNPQ